MNYNGVNPYSSTNYHSVDRDTARTLINDITYKPSADEIAAIERHEAARQAAKDAKAARKAERAELSRQAKQAKQERQARKHASSYSAGAAYSAQSFGAASYNATWHPAGAPSAANDTYTSQPTVADDKASVFSGGSSRRYSSFRSLLSRKHHGKGKK
ncbi:uncharacterized protein SPSK_00617 [Sporothrix schenckii 1099-18]|uniref:Uncharacterized protein n=2 Tax=Sporothrix schenckii TaxID=29908 RepID=U7Q3Y9_SPOS1|nr:uncharacterized protein SPSK_00617 [Sporothrix schenckii 1099-18]ERT02614.1 hypothetical protein HMPREF1624_00915 [Sporothrix schenckii ATCC 58251]KJR80089.1 hypothetical protein SPSK_00617 [Sporothrix schenckii 1099-18]